MKHPTHISRIADGKKPGSVNSFFQPKLTINQPGDSFEQEADTMANKVIQDHIGFPKKDFFKPAISTIQRKCDHCEQEEDLQRKESSDEKSIPSEQTENYIGSLNGAGRSLTHNERSFFEPKFGYDFSNVRIHADSKANESAKSLHALAYTHGNNIIFGNEQYKPETTSGKKLLAHELTHVVQQQGSISRFIQKADIEYRILTWADFQAPVPAKNPFDAETASDIKYPDLTTIKASITEKQLDEVCDTKGPPPQKSKKVEATIGMDSTGIHVTSFFSQEKSWVKPLFKDEAEMIKFCKTDTQTLGFIKACTDSFAKAPADAAKACKPNFDQCNKNVKEGKTTIDGDVEIKDAAGCTKMFEDCKKAQIAAATYKSGGGTEITKSTDCAPVFQAECLESRKKAGVDLLSHEQGHFDITDVIAKKLESDLKGLIDGYAKKTVTGCGHDEAQKLANDVVEKEVKPKINDKVKEAQAKVNETKGYVDDKKKQVPGKLKDTQGSYDTETTHGTKTDEQKQWKDKIGKGNI